MRKIKGRQRINREEDNKKKTTHKHPSLFLAAKKKYIAEHLFFSGFVVVGFFLFKYIYISVLNLFLRI